MEKKPEIGTIKAAHSKDISIAPFVMSVGGSAAAILSIIPVCLGYFSLLAIMIVLAFVAVSMSGSKRMQSLTLKNPAFVSIAKQYKAATGKKLSNWAVLLLLKSRKLSVGGGDKLLLKRKGALDHVILVRRQK